MGNGGHHSELFVGNCALTDGCHFLCFSSSSTKYKCTHKMVSPHSIAHHFGGRDTKRLTPPTPCYTLRDSKSFVSDLKSGESPHPRGPGNSDAIQLVWNLSLSP